MARTRQKRKAKQREQQLKATRQSAAAKEQPMNPAEQAVIDQAEALEVADELEEQIESDAPVAEAAAPPAPAPAKQRAEKPERAAEPKKPERRREREAGAPARSRASAGASSTSWCRCGRSCAGCSGRTATRSRRQRASS